MRTRLRRTQYGPLSPAEGLVPVLGPIVDPAIDLLFVGIADLACRYTIELEAAGIDRRW